MRTPPNNAIATLIIILEKNIRMLDCHNDFLAYS